MVGTLELDLSVARRSSLPKPIPTPDSNDPPPCSGEHQVAILGHVTEDVAELIQGL